MVWETYEMKKLHFYDVSDKFGGNKENKVFPIVQFAVSKIHGDVYLDVRRIKSSNQKGFVILTANGGVGGLKEMLKFLHSKRKKLIRLLKKIRKMTKSEEE
jgi:hypothetical protein